MIWVQNTLSIYSIWHVTDFRLVMRKHIMIIYNMKH